MLAKRRELDIFHDYHLIVIFMKDGAVYDATKSVFIALCEEEHGLGIALWGVD